MKRTIQTAEALDVPYEQWKVLNEIDAVSEPPSPCVVTTRLEQSSPSLRGLTSECRDIFCCSIKIVHGPFRIVGFRHARPFASNIKGRDRVHDYLVMFI